MELGPTEPENEFLGCQLAKNDFIITLHGLLVHMCGQLAGWCTCASGECMFHHPLGRPHACIKNPCRTIIGSSRGNWHPTNSFLSYIGPGSIILGSKKGGDIEKWWNLDQNSPEATLFDLKIMKLGSMELKNGFSGYQLARNDIIMALHGFLVYKCSLLEGGAYP